MSACQDSCAPKDIGDINKAPKEQIEDLSAAKNAILSGLGWLDRLLSLLIIIAMIVGVVIGEYADNVQETLYKGQLEGVAAPLVVGLIVMMWPVLTKVEYELIWGMMKTIKLWTQLLTALVLNWIIGPFVMLACAWATLPDLEDYRTGLIMVGIARCIAMVAIWNQIAGGDHNICAIIVIINSLMQIVLYPPYALLFVNIISNASSTVVSYEVTAKAVAIYLGIPLGAGIVTRYTVMAIMGKERMIKYFFPYFGPLSLIGLLYIIIIIFALQAKNILDNIGDTFRVIVPLALYFILMWFITFFFVYKLSKRYGKGIWGYQMAVVQSFTAASNNFELAIAVCIAVFGANSPQAIAASMGPLVEVPVLLALTWVALYASKHLSWDKSENYQNNHKTVNDVEK